MREYMEIGDIVPLMTEVIANGGTFRFYPRGISMLPMLKEHEDSVELGKADSLAVGDVVFYRRDDGNYVLHRLIAMEKNTLTMCGDNQRALEYNIRPEQVIAKLCGFYKGEHYHSVGEEVYMRYAKRMVSRFPFYRRNQKICDVLRKIKHMIIK